MDVVGLLAAGFGSDAGAVAAAAPVPVLAGVSGESVSAAQLARRSPGLNAAVEPVWSFVAASLTLPPFGDFSDIVFRQLSRAVPSLNIGRARRYEITKVVRGVDYEKTRWTLDLGARLRE